jgi:hypothetical protein
MGQPPDPRDTTVRRVVVTPPAAAIKPGGQVQLGVSIDAGAGVTNRTVTWTSMDTAIALVDQKGLVTAGTATGGVVLIFAASNFNPTIVGNSKIAAAILLHTRRHQGLRRLRLSGTVQPNSNSKRRRSRRDVSAMPGRSWRAERNHEGQGPGLGRRVSHDGADGQR